MEPRVGMGRIVNVRTYFLYVDFFIENYEIFSHLTFADVKLLRLRKKRKSGVHENMDRFISLKVNIVTDFLKE